MTLTELKARYIFYYEETADKITKEKYYKGFSYKPGLQEDIQAENEAVLGLIEEKEKILN